MARVKIAVILAIFAFAFSGSNAFRKDHGKMEQQARSAEAVELSASNDVASSLSSSASDNTNENKPLPAFQLGGRPRVAEGRPKVSTLNRKQPPEPIVPSPFSIPFFKAEETPEPTAKARGKGKARSSGPPKGKEWMAAMDGESFVPTEVALKTEMFGADGSDRMFGKLSSDTWFR
jgi:hypothetical protein